MKNSCSSTIFAESAAARVASYQTQTTACHKCERTLVFGMMHTCPNSISMPFSNGGTLCKSARLPCNKPYGGPQKPLMPQFCAHTSTCNLSLWMSFLNVVLHRQDAGMQSCIVTQHGHGVQPLRSYLSRMLVAVELQALAAASPGELRHELRRLWSCAVEGLDAYLKHCTKRPHQLHCHPSPGHSNPMLKLAAEACSTPCRTKC